jgi:protease IV
MDTQPTSTPPPTTSPPTTPPPIQIVMPKQSNARFWLIPLSILLGIVIACGLLPLGGLALLLAFDSGTGNQATLPAATWQEQIVEGSGADRVAIIEVSGAIGANTGGVFGDGSLTQAQLLSQIRQASEDSAIKAVVLRVDSPGGGVVASSELYTALKKLRASGKHLVVSMGSTAASGGYYIAMASEKIYAHPDTLTGSLGVIFSLTNLEGTYEKIGLRSVVYKSGEFKDIGSPSRPSTPAEDQILQSIVNDAYEGFVQVIIDGRSLSREEVLQIADGRVYTGKQALTLKLIDELGDLDAAIVGAKSLAGLENATIIRFTSRNSLRSLLEARLREPQQPIDPLGFKQVLDPKVPTLEYRWVP